LKKDRKACDILYNLMNFFEKRQKSYDILDNLMIFKTSRWLTQSGLDRQNVKII